MKLLATTALCLLLSGCMLRHSVSPGRLNFMIGAECHPTVNLVGCDSDSPPHCRQSVTHYDKGCEKLETKP